jgi:hypothetical protein
MRLTMTPPEIRAGLIEFKSRHEHKLANVCGSQEP